MSPLEDLKRRFTDVPSTAAPVFCALWNSSICHRHAYQSATRRSCAPVATSTLVSSSHSNGAVSAGGSGSHTRTTVTATGTRG